MQLPAWIVYSGGAVIFLVGPALLVLAWYLRGKIDEARASGYRQGSIDATREAQERFARRFARAKIAAKAEAEALGAHAERVAKDRLTWADVDELLKELENDEDTAALVDAFNLDSADDGSGANEDGEG